MFAILIHHILLAATYGAGNYSQSTYNDGILVAIGPVVLPNTGAGWATLIGALFLAIGITVALWIKLRPAKTA